MENVRGGDESIADNTQIEANRHLQRLDEAELLSDSDIDHEINELRYSQERGEEIDEEWLEILKEVYHFRAFPEDNQ